MLRQEVCREDLLELITVALLLVTRCLIDQGDEADPGEARSYYATLMSNRGLLLL